VTSSVAVFEAAIRVKLMYTIKFAIENQENEKIWKSNKFSQIYPSKRWFRIGIHSWLMRADARGSADIIYRVWRISLLCGALRKSSLLIAFHYNITIGLSVMRRGSEVRTSVFGWRTFPDLCLIYGLHVSTLCVKWPIWVNQPGTLSLSSLQDR